MHNRNGLNELSVDELEQLLYVKKREARRERLQRLKDEGRIVEIAGMPPPNPTPPRLHRPRAKPSGALRHYTLVDEDEEAEPQAKSDTLGWRWVINKLLLAVEIVAAIGFILALIGLLQAQRDLNQELAQVQRSEAAANALPTPTATPVIDLVVLPGGHKPPVEGRAPEPGEAGYIPAHLLPEVSNYQPPPIPTPGPEQARRIEIPDINVDSPIYQGMGWEQLRKGVGQKVHSAAPGENGNLVLAAHNDIYGQIFRYLDQLEPGDVIYISSERNRYTYVVRETRVVEPTQVDVMDPTAHSSATLISCYPYLIDNQRIVVFADLAEGEF